MRALSLLLLTLSSLFLASCQTTPDGATGPGRTLGVAYSHNGFNGTQALRFGPYRVEMTFDAGALAKRNLTRGLLSSVVGCREPGCGLPRSPRDMPLAFVFNGPAGANDGRCMPDGDGMQCALGETKARFDPRALGLGAWRADSPFGPLRIEWRDIDNDQGRHIEWRIIDRSEQVLAVVSDNIAPDDAREPSFGVWLADGHPDDHQALAEVVAIVLAYAWHSTSS